MLTGKLFSRWEMKQKEHQVFEKNCDFVLQPILSFCVLQPIEAICKLVESSNSSARQPSILTRGQPQWILSFCRSYCEGTMSECSSSLPSTFPTFSTVTVNRLRFFSLRWSLHYRGFRKLQCSAETNCIPCCYLTIFSLNNLTSKQSSWL